VTQHRESFESERVGQRGHVVGELLHGHRGQVDRRRAAVAALVEEHDTEHLGQRSKSPAVDAMVHPEPAMNHHQRRARPVRLDVQDRVVDRRLQHG
jgi:hypothetical protein